jgi:hypothetical protein|tara:strand:+ start:4108 stop:4350 length:243 start_codon:yes stop_codon:yes gene_type:complete
LFSIAVVTVVTKSHNVANKKSVLKGSSDMDLVKSFLDGVGRKAKTKVKKHLENPKNVSPAAKLQRRKNAINEARKKMRGY